MENVDRMFTGNDRPRRIWPLAVIALVVGAYLYSMLFLSKVPYISDIRSYYYPGWTYFSHAFKSGGLQWWCPGIYCGFPLFADSEMAIFYPLNLLLFRLPTTAGFNYSIILHYLLGGWFTYAYCRRLRLSRAASLFSSIPFVLGGFFLSHMVHPNAVATAAWMPLFLYCLERALAERRMSFYVAAGGVLGLQSLSGFLMIPLMEVVLALFYVLLHPQKREGDRRRPLLPALGGLALTVGLGAALGMIQNLPSYHLVQSSFRAGGLSGQVSDLGSLPPAQLLGLVFPRAFGQGVAQTGYWGAWTFEETYIYIGLLPLLFAPAALLKPRRWHAVFFLGVGTVSLLLCLGNHGLLWPVLRLLPGFNVLKGSSRFILFFNLAALILGGIGFDRWRSGEFPRKLRSALTRFWSAVAAALGGMLLIFIIFYRFNPLGFRDFAAAAARPFLPGVKHASQAVLGGLYTYFTSFRFEYLIPLALLVVFLLLIRGSPARRRPNRWMVALAVIIAVADVFVFASLVIKPVPRALAEQRPQVIDVLEESSAGERSALLKEPGVNRGEFPLCSNQLLPYELEDAFGFSTIPPERLDRFLALLNNEPSAPAFALLGVGSLYSNLVRVGDTPYDLSAPYHMRTGLGNNTYAVAAGSGVAELRFLLDGTVLERTAIGRILIKPSSIGGGRGVGLPGLILEKDSGSGDFLLEVIDGEMPASFRLVEFKSPGYGMGRTALEVSLRLEGLDECEELAVFTACERGLEGTRLAALSIIDRYGRGHPLTPWPSHYSDEKYAVYELEGTLPRAFAVGRVAWASDWRDAVDRAWDEQRNPGEVILIEDEIDTQTRAAIDSLRSQDPDARIVLEGGGSNLTLQTAGGEDAVLVLAIDYLPGWTARLDGEKVSLFSAYGFLTAMYLPAGEHTVEVSYQPPGLTAGVTISAAALLILAVLYMLFRRRESRATAGRAESETVLPPSDPGGISAFFPCYNDSSTLEGLIEKALQVLADLSDDHEVIIVDDGSSDSSGAVIDGLAARYARVRVVRHDINRGYGAALRSGIKTSGKDWVFYTDSDGQYDVEDLRRLHALCGTADVVNGYKESRSDPWYRLLLGSTYNAVIRLVFAIPIRDVDCDFRLMRGDLVRSLDLRSEGGAICVELVKGLQAAGAAFAETPVGHYPREVGKSQFFRLKNLVVMSRELASLWWRLNKRGEV